MMDYAMPRAHMLPVLHHRPVGNAGAGNPLGVRGGGEGGTTPALAWWSTPWSMRYRNTA